MPMDTVMKCTQRSWGKIVSLVAVPEPDVDDIRDGHPKGKRGTAIPAAGFSRIQFLVKLPQHPVG